MKRALVHFGVIVVLLSMGAAAVYFFPRDKGKQQAKADEGPSSKKADGENKSDNESKDSKKPQQQSDDSSKPAEFDDPSKISPPDGDGKPSRLTIRGNGDEENSGQTDRGSYSLGNAAQLGAGGGLYDQPPASIQQTATSETETRETGGGFQSRGLSAGGQQSLGSSGGYSSRYSLGDDKESAEGQPPVVAQPSASQQTTIQQPPAYDAAALTSRGAGSNGEPAELDTQSARRAIGAAATGGLSAVSSGLSDLPNQTGASGARGYEQSPAGSYGQPPAGSTMQPQNIYGGAGSTSPYASGGQSPAGGYSQPAARTPIGTYAQQQPAGAAQGEAGRGALDAGGAYQSLRGEQPQTLDTGNISLGGSALGGAAGLSGSAAPQRSAAAAGGGMHGAGAPGAKQLEGLQTPSLSIEKTAPTEIQVNQPATFHIAIRNVGDVPAHQVVITDQVPQGTSLIDATPQPEPSADGSLIWRLGTIEPGAEQMIAIELMPEQEGEIGSVAQVSFAAHSSVRTVCTKPELEVTQSAPPQVLIGDDMAVSITVANKGTGAATDVVLESDIPEQFTHEAGNQLEYEIGTLRPGETRQISLTLKAEKPGQTVQEIVLRAAGNRTARHRLPMTVVAPELQLAMDGPKLRYLERQATYTLSIGNAGTAPANHIDLIAQLPKGMKYVASDNRGQYDPQRHAVYWSLEQLSPQERGDVQVTAMPIETGEQRILAEARADLGLTASGEATVQVDGLAALLFTVVDTADPIEVGSETTYEIRVTNTGTKPDTNIHVAALLPAELTPVGGDGPTQAIVRGKQVVFEPLPRLAPNDEQVYKVHVKGASPGIQRIRVQVQSDTVAEPVVKEEGTRVYSDQ